jgi:UDP-N-acetylglucosamine 2-epimerase (non-hydrolysing)
MIHFFVGTKAQYIKTAPVMVELDRSGYPYCLIDSGQHADFSARLRASMGTCSPDTYLHARTTDVTTMPQGLSWLSKSLMRLASGRKRLRAEVFGGKTGICVVHGDTASTLLGALYARAAGLPVAHLESGLRSYRYLAPFPEELIRVLVMRWASLLFAPDDQSVANLRRMKVPGTVIHTQGNTIVDAIQNHRDASAAGPAKPGDYILFAFHRLETLQSRQRINAVVSTMLAVRQKQRVLFVVHPPTRKALERFKLWDRLSHEVELLPSQDHASFLALIRHSRAVMADGGSIQEECAALGVPLLILRDRSERTDGLGQNAMFGHFDPARALTFLDCLEELRRPPMQTSGSPSRVVAEYLMAHDRATGGAGDEDVPATRAA